MEQEQQQNPTEEIYKQASRYFHNHITDLIEIYGGRHVLIHSGYVMDSDTEELRLAARVEIRAKFDLKNAAPLFHVPKTLEEYLEFKRAQERSEPAIIDGAYPKDDY